MSYGACEGCDEDHALHTVGMGTDAPALLCATCVWRVQRMDRAPAVPIVRRDLPPEGRLRIEIQGRDMVDTHLDADTGHFRSVTGVANGWRYQQRAYGRDSDHPNFRGARRIGGDRR